MIWPVIFTMVKKNEEIPKWIGLNSHWPQWYFPWIQTTGFIFELQFVHHNHVWRLKVSPNHKAYGQVQNHTVTSGFSSWAWVFTFSSRTLWCSFSSLSTRKALDIFPRDEWGQAGVKWTDNLILMHLHFWMLMVITSLPNAPSALITIYFLAIVRL